MSDSWVRAVGDEDYVQSVKHGNERKKLNENIHSHIKQVLTEAFASDTPVTLNDSSQNAVNLCFALENIMTYGLKSRHTATGKISFWNFIESSERNSPELKECVKMARSFPNVKSMDGKGRSLIRYALNVKKLDLILQSLVYNNNDALKTFYEEWSCLIAESNFLASLLVSVNVVDFEMTYDTPQIDFLFPPTFSLEEPKKPINPKKSASAKKKSKKKQPTIEAAIEEEKTIQSVIDEEVRKRVEEELKKLQPPPPNPAPSELTLGSIIVSDITISTSGNSSPRDNNNIEANTEPAPQEVPTPIPESTIIQVPVTAPIPIEPTAGSPSSMLSSPHSSPSTPVDIPKEPTSTTPTQPIAIPSSSPITPTNSTPEATTPTTPIISSTPVSSSPVLDITPPDIVTPDIVTPDIATPVQSQEKAPDLNHEQEQAIERLMQQHQQRAAHRRTQSQTQAELDAKSSSPVQVAEIPLPDSPQVAHQPTIKLDIPVVASLLSFSSESSSSGGVSPKASTSAEKQQLIEATRVLLEQELKITDEPAPILATPTPLTTSASDVEQSETSSLPSTEESTLDNTTDVVLASDVISTIMEQENDEYDLLAAKLADSENSDQPPVTQLQDIESEEEMEEEPPQPVQTAPITSSKSLDEAAIRRNQPQEMDDPLGVGVTNVNLPQSVSDNKYLRKYFKKADTFSHSMSSINVTNDNTKPVKRSSYHNRSQSFQTFHDVDIVNNNAEEPKEPVPEPKTDPMHKPFSLSVDDFTQLLHSQEFQQQYYKQHQELNRATSISQKISPVSSLDIQPSDKIESPIRKRIYFNVQIKKTLQDQNYICNGCFNRLSAGFFKQVKYCEYTGKYYCKQCQLSGQKFYIPGRILQFWDLRQYPVSNFAKEFLTTIYEEPLFDVSAINSNLYKSVPHLKTIRALRKQLIHMKDFITSCKKAKETILPLVTHDNRLHLISDMEFYSLRDFVDLSQGTLLTYVRMITEKFISHIMECRDCKSRGGICPICKSPKRIFAFDLKSTIVCNRCNTVLHIKCYEKNPCPVCFKTTTFPQT